MPNENNLMIDNPFSLENAELCNQKTGLFSSRSENAKWHVLWTKSNCEQLVFDQLTQKGYELLLPKIRTWALRRNRKCIRHLPMFKGYLFIHHCMEKHSYIEVSNTKGLVKILGERWDGLGVVPNTEITGIQKLTNSSIPAAPHPYMKEGQRVRVVKGPLTGAEGNFKEYISEKGLLILSIDLLKRSVAVEIDCTAIRAV